MTVRKHFKRLVRTRMERTGESYSAARRVILHQTVPEPKGPWHFPGSIPATTALRVLLTNAGVRDPRTGRPFTEATLYGIAGGVGIGVFAFVYGKDDFASFFVAGRHDWHDAQAYLSGALERFGITPVVRETGSVKAADKFLREALANGPCVAWLDMSYLPHRGLPAYFCGGGYHIVSVYRIEEDGTALIGDLTDDPVRIPGPLLAQARARIKADKNRILSIPAAATPKDVAPLVRDGLRACHAGLTGAGAPESARTNFSLDALGVWADRLHGTKGKDGWEIAFVRGKRFWHGLTSVHQFVEYWGTGGGLGRPLFAESLTEAADILNQPGLRTLSERYADLGHAWTELADAALPGDVTEFREARELFGRIAELSNNGGDPADVRAAWARLEALGQQAKDKFPLSESACDSLRADLQRRVRAIHAAEVAAHADLGRFLS